MNYVFEIDSSDIDAFIEYYKGFEDVPEDEHKLIVFKTKRFTVTIYRSNKVMIQGKDAYDEYLMWSGILGFEPMSKKDKPKQSKPHENWARLSAIGSDEVGTGDFYGPVVVCACYVDLDDFNKAKSLGVKDSKNIKDDQIKKVAPKLMETFLHSVLVLDNEKYNGLVDQGYNMNKIKAYLHNHAIRKTIARTKQNKVSVIIDQFCTKKQYFDYLDNQPVWRHVQMIEKGESYHPAVAAASIIARYTFIKKMDAINDSLGIMLPYGAGPAVDLIGKRIGMEEGIDIFKKIAKINFKNMNKIKDLL